MQTFSTWWPWLAVAGIFFAAGMVKGVIGLGLPTMSMALLALFMLPSRAAALLVLPSLLTNLWQLRPWATMGSLLRQTGTLQIGTVIGTLGAGLFWGAPAGAWASLLLGLALCIYAASSVAGWQLPPGHSRWGIPVGIATGLITALCGVFVIPAVPYLQSLRLDRDRLVQAMGLSFTVSTLALWFNLLLAGVFRLGDLSTSISMVIPALLGMSLGIWLRQRLSAQTFRRGFLLSLAILGVYLIAAAWPKILTYPH